MHESADDLRCTCGHYGSEHDDQGCTAPLGPGHCDCEAYEEEDPDRYPSSDFSEPAEGDYILAPAPPLGSRTSLSICGGPFLGTFVAGQVIAAEVAGESADDVALEVARRRMHSEGYFPNVWQQDDHGGYTLLDRPHSR